MKQYIETSLKCTLCKNILRQPVECKSCESTFCQKCFGDSKLMNEKCPSCETKYPISMDINRNLKNILLKAKVKCLHCKVEFDFEALDEHELQCGRCLICKTGFNQDIKIPGHYLSTCPEFLIDCFYCQKAFKRSKFKNHQCIVNAAKSPDISQKPPKTPELEPLIAPPPLKNLDNLSAS